MGSKPVKASDLGVSVGQVFETKYRVDAIIGQGGMGIVCACTNLQLGKKIAIKMLRPDVLLDVDATMRFKREASAASQLTSEYVAKVTDYGVFENKVPFMVMEYLDGLDLADHLEQAGTIPIQWACDLVLQAAEALAEAHSIGIIHRDVKPTNLFLTWRLDGSSLVKVLDFGISKSRTGVDMQLTQTQSLLGTPSYMSPEQMRSARDVDARSDIWSLGTVLYEIVEGHRPFEADSFSEMCVKVAMDPPIPMRNAPPALQAVILRCLAKSSADRYDDMAQLGRDLIQFTKDPHQSTILVERMQRLIRRSWDNGIPHVVHDRGSAPAAARANIGSQPAMEPYNPAPAIPSSPSLAVPRESAMISTAVTNRDDSIRALLPRRRWLPWVVLGALTISGIVIGAVMANSGGTPAVSTKVGPPQPSGPMLSPKHDVAAKPDDAAAKHEDVAAKPDDVAAKPDDVAAKHDDVAAKHDDVAAKPDEPPTQLPTSDKAAVKPGTKAHPVQTTQATQTSHVKASAPKVEEPPGAKSVTVDPKPETKDTPEPKDKVVKPCDQDAVLSKPRVGDNDPCGPHRHE